MVEQRDSDLEMFCQVAAAPQNEHYVVVLFRAEDLTREHPKQNDLDSSYDISKLVNILNFRTIEVRSIQIHERCSG